MNGIKVRPATTKGKEFDVHAYDHFVAIDWSIQTMAIAHWTRRGKGPKVFERPSDIKELKAYLVRLGGRVVVAIEETTTAQWLYLELVDMVERIIICDPYRNRLLCDGPKTDKIDATKLCSLLRAGLLKEVFHSANELYELRSLMSAYEDLVQAGVRCLNQRTALVQGHRDTAPSAAFIRQHQAQTIDLYRSSKEAYEKLFDKLVQRHRLARNLLTVKGIGPIGAIKILTTVVDAHRFARSGQYLAYCGLVKHEKLSGGRSYGRRNPRYNHRLKSVYKLAAMSVLSGNNPFREYYDALLAKGIAPHHARNAVARYIARVTHGMLKHATTYQAYTERHHAEETLGQ